MSDLREAAQQALEALENHTAIKHPQQRSYRDAAITAIRAALAEPPINQCAETCERAKLCAVCARGLAEPQIEDPAIHFCHRFAILMECMMLSNDSNLDKYWDEAHALLDGYNAARDKWMEAQWQPYVSGFGKD